ELKPKLKGEKAFRTYTPVNLINCTVNRMPFRRRQGLYMHIVPYPRARYCVAAKSLQPQVRACPTNENAGRAYRTPGVPTDRSALAVLGRLAGLLEAVLLALDGPRVAGQEAGLL